MQISAVFFYSFIVFLYRIALFWKKTPIFVETKQYVMTDTKYPIKRYPTNDVFT
jgi:ABC-type uncharacterized transport system permease subunit